MSQDQVGIKEIIDGVDLHDVNQKLFGLKERRIAKIFLFRLIYGGSCWSYAKDPDFNFLSKDPDWWQNVINQIYAKYTGLLQWHTTLVLEVMEMGEYISPTGRHYNYVPYRNSRGESKWPRTKILNYPVQGLSADLMMLARLSAWKRLRPYGDKVLFCNTVHDSIDLDVEDKAVDVNEIAEILKQVFRDVPLNFDRIFGSKSVSKFNVPLACSVSIGPNLLSMKKI